MAYRMGKAKGVWIPEAEDWLTKNYGAKIAEGAEARVYAKTGDTHVVKLRTSIYATWKPLRYTTIFSLKQ